MMDASRLLDDLSVRIYEPPLASIRDDGRIADTSNPLAVIMLLIDYETECSLNGITGYLGNASGQYLSQTIDALRMVGCSDHADVLQQIRTTAIDGGMTHDAVQRDRAHLEAFSVTSFAEVHGDKWDELSETLQDLHDSIDWDDLFPAMTEFVARHTTTIQRQLSQ